MGPIDQDVYEHILCINPITHISSAHWLPFWGFILIWTTPLYLITSPFGLQKRLYLSLIKKTDRWGIIEKPTFVYIQAHLCVFFHYAGPNPRLGWTTGLCPMQFDGSAAYHFAATECSSRKGVLQRARWDPWGWGLPSHEQAWSWGCA